jgi:uncharacterized membrane protein YoaK (UPF0700 family)
MKHVSILLLVLLGLASAKSFPSIRRQLQRGSRNAAVERTRTLPIATAFVDHEEEQIQVQAQAEDGTPTIPVVPYSNPKGNVAGANMEVLTSTTTTTTTSESSSSGLSMEETKKTWFIISLVILTGVSEAICFRRFGCFPNMMTGNTVRSMSFLADLEFEKAFFHAVLIGSYVGGGGLFSNLDALVTKTNKTNKLPNDSKATLPLVATTGLILFCGSDLLNLVTSNARAGLPILALGYGMINAATLSVVGTVTNAVTGHWTKVGLGIGDYLVNHQQQQGLSSKGLFRSISAGCVVAFSLSVVGTGIVFNRIMARPAWLAIMPPFGTSFGVLYALLLTWYSQTSNKA